MALFWPLRGTLTCGSFLAPLSLLMLGTHPGTLCDYKTTRLLKLKVTLDDFSRVIYVTYITFQTTSTYKHRYRYNCM